MSATKLVTTEWLAKRLETGDSEGGTGRLGCRRVRRGRAAVWHRPHPGRGEGRLAHRTQRPGHPRLSRRGEGSPRCARPRASAPTTRSCSTATTSTGGRPTRCGSSPCSATVTCASLTAAGRSGSPRGGRSPRRCRTARRPATRCPPGTTRGIRAFRDDVHGAHRRRPAAGRRAFARANTAASCCTCPTIRRRARCAAGTSPARSASRGSRPRRRTARSSRPTSCAGSTPSELGLAPDDDIIAYCRIGERSSHTWFVLTHLLGYQHVRNYDGSWTEWGNLVRVPVVKGSSPK